MINPPRRGRVAAHADGPARSARRKPEGKLFENVRNLCQWLGLCPPKGKSMPIPNLVGHFYHPTISDGSYAGFLDIHLINPYGCVMYRELKSETGQLSPEQEAVIELLRRGGHDVDVWDPSDWPDRITSELQEFRRRRPILAAV